MQWKKKNRKHKSAQSRTEVLQYIRLWYYYGYYGISLRKPSIDFDSTAMCLCHSFRDRI